MSPERYRGLVLAVAVVALAGCGEGDGGNGNVLDFSKRPGDTASTGPAPVDTRPSTGSASRRAPGTTGARNPRDPLEGRQAVPHPGGGTFYPPVKPRVTKTPPPTGCASNDIGEPRPPKPGFEAMRVDSTTIRVKVVLGRLPASCLPSYIRLSFDVNDDYAAPSSPDSGILTPVGEFTPFYDARPARTPERVDVAIAMAVMSNGESGDSARVRIAES